MPELPEVEVVRRGLAAHLESRTFADVAVTGPRAVRRHAAGPEDFAARVRGARIRLVRRRGKYLWLDLASDEALVAHLGMSGQLLLAGAGQPDPKHMHARFTFDGGGIELRFVDQRTFGVLFVAETDDDGLPLALRHIAPDPFDPLFDAVAVAGRMTKSASGIKRLLLNQTVVSGIGNIYADEALWRAQIHGDRPGDRLTRPVVGRLLDHAREVMHDALGEGGTSFDSLYVDVNGESGYFDRSLDVYGREGQPCRRCGTTIRREQFMNRSSFSCPHCQPRPRRRR